MLFPLDDTIAAVATSGAAGHRGIVRISGPAVVRVIQPWFQSAVKLDSVTSAEVIIGQLLFDDSDCGMPCHLYLWPSRRSYTRQPTIELHTVGNVALLEAIVRNVCRTGARLAQPGEFTLRAFLSGRLDLPQAEAVLGIIDATGQQQFQTALQQLAGGVSEPLNHIRDGLLNLCADLEAGLDFVEEDIEFVTANQARRRLEESAKVVAQLQQQMEQRNVHQADPLVVLLGRPNAGKSALFNALSQDQAAIVSPHAGTTRDVVSRRIRFGRVDCQLIDTAGLEIADDETSNQSQRAARRALENATLYLLCSESRTTAANDVIKEWALHDSIPILRVQTKSDLVTTPIAEGVIATSSITGEGITELSQAIEHQLVSSQHETGEVVGTTSTRCRESLTLVAESLHRAIRLVVDQQGDELVTAELRIALEHLGRIVGAVYTDDVLDRIFSRFCIGK